KMKLLARGAAGRTKPNRLAVGLEQAADDWPWCTHALRPFMKVRICGQARVKILALRARVMLGPSADAYVPVFAAPRVAPRHRRLAGAGDGGDGSVPACGGPVGGERRADGGARRG